MSCAGKLAAHLTGARGRSAGAHARYSRDGRVICPYGIDTIKSELRLRRLYYAFQWHNAKAMVGLHSCMYACVASAVDSVLAYTTPVLLHFQGVGTRLRLLVGASHADLPISFP